ncbi:sulfate adenylyltransferase subunit 1 [Taibaiella koreensis]|uniref:sulfate adenylyltransferase subunit 1 n=1 Tax=Taibaiella koreensis TaxID=1268548 RepID=UPI000E59CA27|nr:GTP-binding protein [Taibaiella koreensis]
MDLLRFITAGSVDDGKSTLIGRLLYDSKSIWEDQLEAIERQSKRRDNGVPDLALLTDGLRAEREQGITIDVAYRYFNTVRRKFIIADAPGHIQYTRNMVTGASNADLIVILIDARHGVAEQTRRHSIIASLLKLPHVIVAVNKMDLVGYAQDVFDGIVTAYSGLARELQLPPVTYLPISALQGDNIVKRSAHMSWYEGPSLLELLEEVSLAGISEALPARFPVQYVIRPQTETLHDYRGYAGQISSGTFSVGDHVTILPSGATTRIARIESGAQQLQTACAPQSVVLHVEGEFDISRGDLIVPSGALPTLQQELSSLICWMDVKPLLKGNRYLLQYNTFRTPVVIKALEYRLDVNSLDRETTPDRIELNEVVRARIKTAMPLAFDRYTGNHAHGAAILIDESSNATVGALMLETEAV